MKLGIALSGGGIKGIAHAGVLKALEENDIKIDIIGGTSSGSLIASLYAMGYSPYYIYILFKKHSKELVQINNGPILSGLKKFMVSKKITLTGLKTGESIEKVFNKVSNSMGIQKISDIKMPVVIPTVDLIDSKEYIFTNFIPVDTQNKERYITDISIGKAVRASSSFTAVFSPCEFKAHKFIDGGALDNVPITEVKKQGADKVIAVKFNSDGIDETSNITDYVMKTIDIMSSKITNTHLNKSDYILDIYTEKTGLLDTQKIDLCYQRGYEATIKNMDKIKEIINE